MMHDIPHVPCVQMAENADNIVTYAHGWNVEYLCDCIQKQITKLLDCTKCWGLVINSQKTKGMFFTLLRVCSPSIRLGMDTLEFVGSHRYLGIQFDSPRLTWRNYISYLQTSCLGKINLLRSISGSSWGADRHILLTLYKSLIRSNFDYGSIFLWNCVPHYTWSSW